MAPAEAPQGQPGGAPPLPARPQPRHQQDPEGHPGRDRQYVLWPQGGRPPQQAEARDPERAGQAARR